MSDSTDDLNPRPHSIELTNEIGDADSNVAVADTLSEDVILAEVAVPDECEPFVADNPIAEEPTEEPAAEVAKEPAAEQRSTETVATPSQLAEPASPKPVVIATHVEPDEVYLEPRAGYDDPINDGTASTEVGFAQLKLSEPLLQSVLNAGYSQPTPIQAKTIPLLLEGRDVIGQAQTGTGKTAAFALPMLELVDLKQKTPQILVLTPTRELAIQVADAFVKYASHLKGLRVMPIYGGQDYTIQFRQLERGVHVIVATPGRVMDHMRRGTLNLDNLRGLVLDEADEMLRMGFAEDVEWVLSQSPDNRQTALFSATMPAPIRKIAKTHLTDPKTVIIGQRTATADTVNQRYVIAVPHQKQMALSRILEGESTDAVLVFVKMRSTTEPLAEFLAAHGHRTAALNGDIPQRRRERTIEQLRAGNIDIIVATDVAARGLDVQRISHVINYDLPHDCEAYIHRIGRTGRAGRSGEAILFVHPREQRMLKRLERETGQPIPKMELPSNRAINKQRVARFHERITKGLMHREMETFEAIIDHYRRENDVPLEHIAAALAVLANGEQPLLANEALKPTAFSAGKQGGRKGKRQDQDKSSYRSARAPRRSNGSEEGMQTYRIEVGSSHDVKPGNIVGAIANEADMDSSSIGRIQIFDQYSTVDLPDSMPEAKIKVLQHVSVAGRRLSLSRMGHTSPSGGGRAGHKRPQTHSSRRTFKKMSGKPKRRKETTR